MCHWLHDIYQLSREEELFEQVTGVDEPVLTDCGVCATMCIHEQHEYIQFHQLLCRHTIMLPRVVMSAHYNVTQSCYVGTL